MEVGLKILNSGIILKTFTRAYMCVLDDIQVAHIVQWDPGAYIRNRIRFSPVICSISRSLQLVSALSSKCLCDSNDITTQIFSSYISH